MADGLALVFIEIDGHLLRADLIESIHPDPGTSYTDGDPNKCYVQMVGSNSTRVYACAPKEVLEKIARALAPLYGEPEDEGDVPDLDEMIGEEPLPPGTTKTRGGTSWGRG